MLEIPEKDLLMPGEDGKLVFNLFKKMVLANNQRFTIRDGSTTMGYGVVSKILPDRDPDELEETRRKLKKERKAAEEESQQSLV